MLENRVRLTGGFRNDVFYIEEKGKIERISDARRTKNMVLQEIEWMNFLYNEGVALSKPEMSLAYEEGRVKTYFEFIQGDEIDVTNESHWNVKIFEQWGKTLGKMHALSKIYKGEKQERHKWTSENPDVFNIRENLASWLGDNYDRLMQSLHTYEITPHTFGLIHNDFHQGNLILTKEGILTAIDFDDCSLNWFAQDIAVAFYHAFWQHDAYNGMTDSFLQIFIGHFFAGYQTENLLHLDIINQIPIFLKLREIFLYQLFIQKWDIDNLEEWQSYTLQDLEGKIKNQTHYAGIEEFSSYL